MFVALRKLNVFGKVVMPGERVRDEDIKRWNVVSLQSNLDIGWLKEVKDVPEQLSKSEIIDRELSQTEGHELECCGRIFKTKGAFSNHKRSHR